MRKLVSENMLDSLILHSHPNISEDDSASMGKLLDPLLRAQKGKHLLPVHLEDVLFGRCMVKKIDNTHLVVYPVLSTITLFQHAT